MLASFILKFKYSKGRKCYIKPKSRTSGCFIEYLNTSFNRYINTDPRHITPRYFPFGHFKRIFVSTHPFLKSPNRLGKFRTNNGSNTNDILKDCADECR